MVWLIDFNITVRREFSSYNKFCGNMLDLDNYEIHMKYLHIHVHLVLHYDNV